MDPVTELGGMTLRATEYGIVGRTAVITLSRPKRRNAWTGRMHAEYRRCLATAERDPAVRVIVVTGSGSAFCVGGDSDALEGHAERGSYDDGLQAAAERTGNSSTDNTDSTDNSSTDNSSTDNSSTDNTDNDDNKDNDDVGFGINPEFDHQFTYHFGLTKPVIAAINGPAAGVGLALACYADLRFAVPGAKLTTAHGKLNLPPEFGLSWILPRHMGLTRAMDVLMTSRVFLTDEAYQFGLINQLHPAEELLSATLEYAETLASSVSAGSLRATRQQVYIDQHRGVGSSVEESLELLTDMMGDADYRKGVAALRAKQPPNF